MDKSKRIILFFVRFPDPGQVKTRLSRDLGDERGPAIYRAFVSDMLDTLVLLGHILPAWKDVDTHKDVIDLYRRGKGIHFARSKTMACLTSVFERGGQEVNP